MAVVSGPEGRSLAIEILGYQHTDTGGLENDFDANWLLCRVTARDGTGAWEMEGPTYLTWEVLELVEWLRALADGLSDKLFFSGFEPNLQFEADEGGDGPALIAVLAGAFLPPEAGKKAEEFPIPLEPGADGIRGFAEELAEAARAFPIRAVQRDGFASSLLAERDGGAG